MITWPLRILFRRNDLIAGLFLLGLSYIPLLNPEMLSGKIGSLVIGAAFYLGVLFLGNWLTLKLGGKSVISLIRNSKSNTRSFTYTCIGIALYFSLIAADLGGLWYFPYWSTTDYFFIGFLLGGWAFYILTLIVCYEAFKILFDRILPQRKRVTRYFGFEKNLYGTLFVIGVMLLSIVVAVALYNTKFFTDFQYTINSPKEPYLQWYYWIIAFTGTFFICEFIEYKRRRSSFIKDTIHGYINPLLAALSVGFLLAIMNEVQNLGVFLWRYANYPWPDVTILEIPLFIIIAWPMHIITFIVCWRAFGNASSSVVFANGYRNKRRVATRKRR